MNLKVIAFQRHELDEVDERVSGEHLFAEEGKQLVNAAVSAGMFMASLASLASVVMSRAGPWLS